MERHSWRSSWATSMCSHIGYAVSGYLSAPELRSTLRIDLVEQTDLGRIDAVIGAFSAVPSRFKSSFLFEKTTSLLRNRCTTSSRSRPRCFLDFGSSSHSKVTGRAARGLHLRTLPAAPILDARQSFVGSCDVRR